MNELATIVSLAAIVISLLSVLVSLAALTIMAFKLLAPLIPA